MGEVNETRVLIATVFGIWLGLTFLIGWCCYKLFEQRREDGKDT
jgi:hypothetical protein